MDCVPETVGLEVCEPELAPVPDDVQLSVAVAVELKLAVAEELRVPVADTLGALVIVEVGVPVPAELSVPVAVELILAVRLLECVPEAVRLEVLEAEGLGF